MDLVLQVNKNMKKDEKFFKERKLKKDLEYIKDEIISKQKNGKYLKWSKLLNAVSVMNIGFGQYINYWEKQYIDADEESVILIREACIEKLTNGLTDPNIMMQMIADSKDFKSEKKQAIKLLGGRYIER